MKGHWGPYGKLGTAHTNLSGALSAFKRIIACIWGFGAQNCGIPSLPVNLDLALVLVKDEDQVHVHVGSEVQARRAGSE